MCVYIYIYIYIYIYRLIMCDLLWSWVDQSPHCQNVTLLIWNCNLKPCMRRILDGNHKLILIWTLSCGLCVCCVCVCVCVYYPLVRLGNWIKTLFWWDVYSYAWHELWKLKSGVHWRPVHNRNQSSSIVCVFLIKSWLLRVATALLVASVTGW